MDNVRKFEKPKVKARFAPLNDQERRDMVDSMIGRVVNAEAATTLVGYCFVVLHDDGTREAGWRCRDAAMPQLARQVRREAAYIAKKFQTTD